MKNFSVELSLGSMKGRKFARGTEQLTTQGVLDRGWLAAHQGFCKGSLDYIKPPGSCQPCDFQGSRNFSLSFRASNVLWSKIWDRLWIVEREQKKKRYSKQGSCLSKGTEGTHGGELGDHGASTTGPLILTFYAVPEPQSRRVPLVAGCWVWALTSQVEEAELVVTVNKSPSQDAPGCL